VQPWRCNWGLAALSKVLKTIGKIAGAVAIVASVIAPPIGAIAAAVSTVANIGARLTAPKPIARGSISQIIVSPEPPRPYLIGETYFAGVLRHKVGYGATLNKVPNPYLWDVVVYSGVSCDALVQAQFNFEAIGSYYSGFSSRVSQVGAVPEATALVPPYGAATGWTSASKLSGCAAIGWNYKFDKDGKVYSSGAPVTGAIWQGARVYDPRLDSTFPGGSGSCRLGNESTYVYSRTPALHAGTYAYGRYQNGTRVFGIGAAKEGIDWNAVAAWANDCELNGWHVDGVIFEGGAESGPEVKAQNLTDICAAGGGEWFTVGAVLSFVWNRPRVALATITDADIIRSKGMDAVSVQPLRERFNTVRPQYTKPSSKWELVTGDPITGSTYVTEDGGEVMTQSWPLNLVKEDEPAGQLATYALANSRELGPWTLNLPSEWRFYRPGECLNVDSDTLGYTGKVIIRERTFDPSTMETRLVVRSETDGKHAFAMGQTAVPPPTPTLGQTAEERDTVRDEIMQNYPVSGRDAEDIATTVAAGGGVAANQVSTDSVQDEAITSVQQASNGSSYTGSGATSWQAIITFNVVMAEPGDIIAITTIRQSFSSGERDWAARLKVDGAVVFETSGTNFADSVALSGKGTVATAGTYSVAVEWAGEDSTVSVPTGGASLISLRRYK